MREIPLSGRGQSLRGSIPAMASPRSGLGAALPSIALAAMAVGCRADPPNVLLLTVDTLRPDALGWVAEVSGAGARSTPNLDRLAAGGLAFPAAVAPAPLTLPSHLTLMSGLVPPRHGVRDNGQVVGAAPELLAERLGAAGWTTAAFVSGFPLASRFGLDRGFSHYDDRFTAGQGAWLERPAPETTAAVLTWLARAPRPWFLWVHYYDPHHPYHPSYAAEVARVDLQIGRLLAAVDEQPVLTVFAADHGESLGEHGEATHGYFVYDSTVLVPLVLHWPGRIAGSRSERSARLVDVAPTVLELLGQPPLAESDGSDLLASAEADLPAAYVETVQPWTSYGWAALRGVRNERWKLIAAPRPELYDLAVDPGEATNVIERHRSEARRLAAVLKEIEARPVVGSAPALADPETRERLRALGYLGAAAPDAAFAGGAATAADLPDPKDRLALRERLTAAQEALEQSRVDAALAIFEEVLEAEPDNRFALSRSGVALLRRGHPADLDRAIPRLERATRLDPLAAETRSALAEALLLAGRDEEAIDAWTAVVSQQPRWATGWGNLGTALGRAGRPTDAVRALERALALDPADPDRLARLAFARHAGGDLEGSTRDLLQLAERLGAERFRYRAALGLLLFRAGRAPDARYWLAASRPEESEYPEARVALARLLMADGNGEEAGRILREAAGRHPRVRTMAAADPALAGLLSR